MAGTWLFGVALVGALLLFAAEFTTLYTQQIGGRYQAPVTAVTAGSEDSYAMIPIALLAIGLATAVLRVGSRPALLALGVAGLVALLIALVGDLPDSRSTLLTGCAAGECVVVRHTSTALYLETLGAVLLTATSGLGFILIGRPGGGGSERRADPPDTPESRS